MNEDSSTATPTPSAPNDEGATPPVNDWASPNDLNNEMSEAEEEAFVNKTLGLPSEPEAPTEPEEPVVTPEKPVESEVVTPKPLEPEEPEQPETPEAPAEIEPVQTDDLWIEVEGDDGETYKVEVNGDYPEGLKFKSDAQLAEVVEARQEMKNLLKERTKEYEEKVAERETSESAALDLESQQQAWDTEIESLIGVGELEVPKIKPGEPGFAEDPAVQRIDAVFQFMKATNEKLLEEGKPVLRSFGTAYTMMKSSEKAEADKKAAEEEDKVTKAKGAMVGGGSSSSQSDPWVYKAGSAGSMSDIKID